jgi:SAM-dependent methyltransferase
VVKPEGVIREDDPETGPRLKFFSQVADINYWTERWRNPDQRSYARAQKGHLPHQLRDTFLRWVPRGSRVLEAGCGPGHFTIAAHARGYLAEGLDWSEPTVADLRRRYPGIPWHVGDVRALKFEDSTFDAVYSPGVCEHFEEGPTAILMEMARVLRPGGIALVSTPCYNVWLERRRDSFPTQAPAPAPFFQYAFTARGLTRVLARIGLEVLHVRPYDTLATLTQYGGLKVPAAFSKPLAVALDYLTGTREWGDSCLWVARTTGRET